MPRSAVYKGMGRPWSPIRLRSVLDDPTRKARFAYAIKTARERRGLTPPQLARLLGIQPSTVNAWEKASKTAAPSILDLGPLCEALGVDANLFAVLPAIPQSPVDDYLTTDDEPTLSPEDEEAVRESVRAARRETIRDTARRHAEWPASQVTRSSALSMSAASVDGFMGAPKVESLCDNIRSRLRGAPRAQP